LKDSTMVDESFIILSKTKYFYKYYLLPTPLKGVVSNTLKNLSGNFLAGYGGLDTLAS